MKVGYIRISSADQNTARQEVLMKELGVEQVYIDKMSGTEAKKFASVFKTPETFIRINDRIFAVPMKPSLKDRLNAAKATANEQNKDTADKSRGKDKEEAL